METLFLLIPLILALIVMPIVKRAPIHGALLAGWASMTFLGFVPGGFFAGALFLGKSNAGGVLILAASLTGFLASVMMVRRLSRLYRGEALGDSRFLVWHHAGVVLASTKRNFRTPKSHAPSRSKSLLRKVHTEV